MRVRIFLNLCLEQSSETRRARRASCFWRVYALTINEGGRGAVGTNFLKSSRYPPIPRAAEADRVGDFWQRGRCLILGFHYRWMRAKLGACPYAKSSTILFGRGVARTVIIYLAYFSFSFAYIVPRVSMYVFSQNRRTCYSDFFPTF